MDAALKPFGPHRHSGEQCWHHRDGLLLTMKEADFDAAVIAANLEARSSA